LKLCAKRRIELYPIQHDFVVCPDRFTAMVAGIGSGKSFAGAVKGLLHCNEPTVGLVVAPSYPMLRDATWRSYQEVCGDAITKFNKGEFLANIGQAEVLFRSADSPDRLRGPNIDWAHIDEAGLCPRQTWEIVIGRLRGHGKAGPCWITSTPKGRNWLYEIISQLTLFRAHTRDNPYIAREFVESLEAAYSGLFAKQELAGEFVGFEGLVYEEFDRNRHIQRRAGPWAQIIMGTDEGYTNPAVHLVIGLDNDGRGHVLEEFYMRRALQADVVGAARELADRHQVGDVFVDPSAAGLIAEMQASMSSINERGGISRTWVYPAVNAVFEGIQAVKAMLAIVGDGRPRLTFDPSCANTIAEMESYCWKQGRAGIRDEPEKTNDHAMDALRYGIMGTRAIEVPPEGIYVYDNRVNISPY